MERVKSLEELPEKLRDERLLSVFHSEQRSFLFRLRHFEPLAWTSGIRGIFYNKRTGELIQEIEGDIYYTKNASVEQIRMKLQKYPKCEVATGERFDPRFNKDLNDHGQEDVKFSKIKRGDML